MKWAYLGPSGTYSEMAVRAFIGGEEDAPDASFMPCPTIEDVFEQVARGVAERGVVPIENSMEGSVNATLDCLLADSHIKIVKETVLDIHHALCAPSDIDLGDVDIVFSHPQAMGQCRRWLQRNIPNATLEPASSTAGAVEQCMNRTGVVAIGNVLAAKHYGATILADAVEDFSGNQTRFVIIERAGEHPAIQPNIDYKTSLALYLKADKPGALLNILAEFAYAEISLTKLQSRPTKQGLGNYMFFVDFKGHVDAAQVRTALDCLRLKLREVRVLGCYDEI